MDQIFQTPDEAIAKHFADMVRLQGTKALIGGQGRVDFPLTHDAVVAEATEPVGREVWKRFANATTAQPLARLDSIIINTGTIAFSGGVPVGGWGHLSLFPSGLAHAAGHFHVSGAPSYNVALGILVVSNNGIPVQVLRNGRVHGTFESGSRNFDWNDDHRSEVLRQAWGNFSAGYHWAWQARADLDFGALLQSLKQAVGVAITAAAIIL